MASRLSLFGFTVGVWLFMMGTARADLVISTSGFSATPNDIFDIALFDPTLGTLNEVQVSINGVLTVTGTAPLNLLQTAGGPVPVPYSYRVDVEQNFAALAGNLFSFATPARFQLIGNASGASDPFTFVVNFSYAFTFDAITDLIGFDIPSFSGASIPPISVVGQRSDFLDSLGAIDDMSLTHIATPMSLGGPVPLVASVGADGSVLVQYVFTRAPGVAPEPSSLVLVAIGAAAALRARRARRQRQPAGR